jgi:hypothetical protein
MATPLATVADLTARGVVVAPTEESAVATFLDVASAAVRAAAGSQISESTDTVTLAGPRDTRLTLPAGPVSAVESVLLNGVPVTDFAARSGALSRCEGWAPEPDSEVTVTYTHGFPVVPADIVELVCRMAASALVEYRSDPASALTMRQVQSERAGEYSVSYTNAQLASAYEVPEYLRARLAARFGGGSAVVVKQR